MKFASLIFACLLITASCTAAAHTPDDPNFLHADHARHWKTLSTEHFRINHEASQQQYAQRMAVIAERVHEKLSAWLHWQPEQKTEIMILDTADYSNGAATPLPYNQFYIYMPTPSDSEIMGQNPWMEYVFTHEYVHILQLDMADGFPKFMRDMLGRPLGLMTGVTFPELFAPSWVSEGLAVYGESDNSAGYGRLNNAWYEAMMRMEVQRGLRSLNEISYEGYSGSRWPYGSNYLYGAYFFKFIEQRYGRDSVTRYITLYDDNIIPWRMDDRAIQAFGEPAEQLWHEYQDYLRQRFAPQLAQLQAAQNTALHTVYDVPYLNKLLTASGQGDLYFYHDDAASLAEIRRISADGKNETVLEAEGVSGLSWNDTSGLLLNKMTVCDNTNYYAELYLWQPGMPEAKRLTHCGRYVHAAWRADGQQIAAVQLENGRSRLVLLDTQGQATQLLAELALGDSLGPLDWSPDGQSLVAAVKRQHTGWNLELFDLRQRSWQALTLNHDLETRPHFSADGRSVYFLSDHDKVWNLRRINLADKTITTLSHSVSAILDAVAMPDGSYRITEYTAQGQAIRALIPSDGASYAAISAVAPRIEAYVNQADYQPAAYVDVHDYSPLESMKPRSWVPFLMSSEQNSLVGVSLYGADVLGFHRWSLAPYLDIDQHLPGAYASYQYLNTLTLLAGRQAMLYGKNSDPSQYRADNLYYQALLHHSFNSTEHSIYIATGISSESITDSYTRNAALFASTHNTLTGALIRYDSTDFFQRAISLSDGRQVQLSGESYQLFNSNSYRGNTWQFDWKEYLGLGRSQVLYLRGLLASGDPGIRPYTLGGTFETPVTLDGSSELGRRHYMLRGYPTGLASLSGTQLGLFTAEWRVPLGLVYDGWFVPPVGLGKHALSLFIDSGDTWNQGDTAQFKSSIGIAWNAEALLGYDLLHLGITLGFAHGLDQGGENQLYLSAGVPF